MESSKENKINGINESPDERSLDFARDDIKAKNIWTKKNDKPLLVLAPMAGYTDAAFRLLCREFGADIVVTELISADAIAYGKIRNQKSEIRIDKEVLTFNRCAAGKNKNTAELLSFFEEERPLMIQLFGKYPEKFAKAAKWVSDNLKPDGIDINMGCPARKVVGSDHGAALLKNCDLAEEIVRSVKANTDLPVSVKTRLGWENDDEILEFAPRLQKAGIDAIIIHGRTYKDGFKGQARWENVYKIKNLLNIPVIANGDVKGIDDKIIRTANCQLQTANLDGVAIGRAAFGKPWIFQEKSKVKSQKSQDWWPFHGRAANNNLTIDKEFLSGVISRHAELEWGTKGERGIIELRKHLVKYLSGFENSKALRIQAVQVKTLEDVKGLLEKF